MYNNETKNQFIELRAEGLSLDEISSRLNVHRATLGRWHHESIEQIQRLRSIQWHLLEEQIGHRLEDTLGRVAQRIRKWEDKLDRQVTVYQKPGDSIRVIRESRREYLQLRALLLAPLQPARGNAPCLTSLDPHKRDKTRQTPDALDITSQPTNDLQQPETPTSHSATAEGPPLGGASSVEPAAPSRPAPELETDAESCPGQANVLPLPGAAETQSLGENDDSKLGRGEGQTSTLLSAAPPSANAANDHPIVPPPSVAESSDTITANNGSSALPLPGAADAPASRRATFPALGRGEGQTGSSLVPDSDQSVISNVKSEIASSPPSSLNHNHTLNHDPDSSSASQRLGGEPSDVITVTQPLINTPLQRGEPTQPLADTTASAVFHGPHGDETSSILNTCAPVTPEVTRGLILPGASNNATPQPANAADDSPFDQSEIQNLQPKIDADDFLGSIVINPYECAAVVVLKTLEHEAAHRARQPASHSQLSTNNPQLTYELMRVDQWQ